MSTCPITGDELCSEQRYFSPEDVNSRLTGTFILYKGKAIYVKAAHDRILTYQLAGADITPFSLPLPQVHSESIYLEISSPPLGYLNSENRCYYVKRVPKRRWKQGIDAHSVIVTSHNTTGGSVPITHFNTKFVANMLEGTYLTVKKILEECALGHRLDGAFHRRWAIGNVNTKEKTALLYYKGEVAGYLDWKETYIPRVKMLESFYHSTYVETLVSAGITVG